MGNSPLRAPRESEQQTLVLRGIQVILLVRLVALVSNRASRVGPALAQVESFFMDSGARQRMNYCWQWSNMLWSSFSRVSKTFVFCFFPSSPVHDPGDWTGAGASPSG